MTSNSQTMTELQRAGLALKTLRARLSKLEEAAHEPIAIVGLGCRFPGGAADPEALWSLLERGADVVTEVPAWRWNKAALFDPEPGKPGKLYTLDAGWLEDVDRFDAGFFAIAPKEATSMDPQHRLLLETCWMALEEAGEAVDRSRGAPVGMFLGITSMDYAQQTIQAGRPELLNAFYTTGVTFNGGAGRVAYTFGFTGPCMAVDTACSSSLVALHLAVSSLRRRECNMALAAGVNVNLYPGNTASMCEARLISPTGRCRTFDASADGMVRGEGCGVVVLKRLSDALADGNHIHALIRGSAVNQDGASSSLAAPNGRAQEAVIRAALADAQVEPREIDYVEAHGSATPIGDPIEVRALGSVYGRARSAGEPLLIGSVKTNLGHLESAAGVAGLFKVVLSLTHERIARQLHLERPSDEVDWEQLGVRVCAEDHAWPRAQRARRAAVSGFGVSGTNAHVILEEAPPASEPKPGRAAHALLLSAMTASALESATQRLIEHLRVHPEQDLADVAYTLQVGRASLPFRRALTCRSRQEAIDWFASLDAGRVTTRQVARGRQRPVVFMFPGTGEQFVGMARELYLSETVFRAAIDQCAQLLAEPLGQDLASLLYPADSADLASPVETGPVALRELVQRAPEPAGPLTRTLFAHAAVFAVEYALGRLFLSLGVKPQLLLGYSTGEYVAACLAGVLSLEDALAVLTERARLIERCAEGAMLSVMAGEENLQPVLGDGVWLAALNGPELSVLAGSVPGIERAATQLEARGIACQRVPVQQAFHCPLIAGIEAELLAVLRRVTLRRPEIPIISNVTGQRLTDAEACDPGYWYRHAVSPVRFAEGIASVWQRPERILLELGPGQSLCSFALQQAQGETELALSSVPGRHERTSPVAFLQSCLAKLWLHGAELDWAAAYEPGTRRKLPLPLYPFERERYWIETAEAQATPAALPAHDDADQKQPIDRWYFVPEWRSRALPPELATSASSEHGGWLILGDEGELCAALTTALAQAGVRRVTVTAGAAFRVLDEHRLELDPTQPEHYHLLAHHLASQGIVIRRVVLLWPAQTQIGQVDLERTQVALERGFHSLHALLQALGETPVEAGISVLAVSSGSECVLGDDVSAPEAVVIDGLLRVAPQELAGLRCARLDLPAGAASSTVPERWVSAIVRELARDLPEPLVAYRGATRWVRELVPVQLAGASPSALPLRRGGVYVVTGGLGGIGRTVAMHLAKHWAAKLVLLGRSSIPAPETWDEVLARGDADPDYERVSALRSLLEQGADVLPLVADVSDRAALSAALDRARSHFGSLHGIFHCAGVPGSGLILTKPREACDAVFAAKVRGTLLLAEACKRDELELVVYFSSTLALHGAIGQADYAGANAFLDSFAHYQRSLGVHAVSIDWGMWQFDAWQDKLTAALPSVRDYLRERRERLGIGLEEGMDALDRSLSLGAAQVVVSSVPFDRLLRAHQELDLAALGQQLGAALHQRPASLMSEYVAPRSDTERVLSQIWSDTLGLDRVGIVDNFFELGGHSILGAKIMGEISRRFALTLPLRELFRCPTVEQLAALLEEQILADIEAMADKETLGEVG
jgi:acyl transferase domain-containing protein/acyl carrier protein